MTTINNVPFSEEEIKAKEKEMRKAYNAQYYAKNKDKLRETVKNYRRKKAIEALAAEQGIKV